MTRRKPHELHPTEWIDYLEPAFRRYTPENREELLKVLKEFIDEKRELTQ